MLVWWKLQQCFKRLKLQVKRSRRIKDMTLENPDKQKDCGVKEMRTRHCLGTLVIGDGGVIGKLNDSKEDNVSIACDNGGRYSEGRKGKNKSGHDVSAYDLVGDFLWRNDNDKTTVATAGCNGKQEFEEDGGLDDNKGEDNVLVESVNDWR
ncbi:hypothetical protein Tco_1142533 [Tanacetum coccineum]